MIHMETKVALLVIYNHRFDKNIKRVQELYSKKFSYIYHVVPFYDGKIEGVDVIPVYESSYNFQGYISQAYQHLKNNGFTHYFIIADDLIVNPIIDENNLWEEIGAEKDDCFMISKPDVFQKPWRYWDSVWDAMTYKRKQKGVEILNILPTKEEAEKKFKEHGFPVGKVPFKAFLSKQWRAWVRFFQKIPWSRTLDYPLVGCYSDTFMVTNDVMERFCTYCGAFAATNLFVEVACPTSLVLSTDKLKFDSDLKLHDGALWPDTIHELDKYNFSLSDLLENFPRDKFFIHPVKLSKWK